MKLHSVISIGSIVWYIGVISGIFGILQGILWLLGYGPKSTGEELYSYIDYEKNLLIEENVYKFSWGIIFFLKTISLQKIGQDTMLKISCKPLARPMRSLPDACYFVKDISNKRVIKLRKNRIYDDLEIEKIHIITKTPIEDQSEIEGISTIISGDSIVVSNDTHHEIRNYLVDLPDEISLDRIPPTDPNISGFIIPEPNDADLIKIKIKKIPPCDGSDPSTITIRLVN